MILTINFVICFNLTNYQCQTSPNIEEIFFQFGHNKKFPNGSISNITFVKDNHFEKADYRRPTKESLVVLGRSRKLLNEFCKMCYRSSSNKVIFATTY